METRPVELLEYAAGGELGDAVEEGADTRFVDEPRDREPSIARLAMNVDGRVALYGELLGATDDGGSTSGASTGPVIPTMRRTVFVSGSRMDDSLGGGTAACSEGDSSKTPTPAEPVA